MVSSDQIDFAEDDFARQVGREIVEPRYQIPVVSCDAIQLAKISACSVLSVRLGNHVER